MGKEETKKETDSNLNIWNKKHEAVAKSEDTPKEAIKRPKYIHLPLRRILHPVVCNRLAYKRKYEAIISLYKADDDEDDADIEQQTNVKRFKTDL